MPHDIDLQTLVDEFTPSKLAIGGYAQTIAAKLFKDTPSNTGHSEPLMVPLSDGDTVSFVIDHPDGASKPVIFALFHGLGGSSESEYNLRLSKKLRSLGCLVARYSHRGCGPLSGHAAKNIYHCGSSDDMHQALVKLHERFPRHDIYLLGFSLSGAVLLNFLGRQQNIDASFGGKVKAALAICPPLDLEASSQRLSRKRNFVFDQFFSILLVRQVKERERRHPDLESVKFNTYTKLRDFDEVYTAKFGGFENRHHYYSSSSPNVHLGSIKLPTTVLGAVDDPIVCPDDFRRDYKNPNVKILLSKSGGHMGFISAKKTDLGDHRWMDAFVLAWANNLLLKTN